MAALLEGCDDYSSSIALSINLHPVKELGNSISYLPEIRARYLDSDQICARCSFLPCTAIPIAKSCVPRIEAGTEFGQFRDAIVARQFRP